MYISPFLSSLCCGRRKQCSGEILMEHIGMGGTEDGKRGIGWLLKNGVFWDVGCYTMWLL
jgi:hypothetical protein